MHYIYRKDSSGSSIIYIKGRVESVNKLVKQIPEFEDSGNETGKHMDVKEITLDLAEVEFISEDTLKYFQRLKLNYGIPVKFRNYSLYIEMLLEDFNLLNE